MLVFSIVAGLMGASQIWLRTLCDHMSNHFTEEEAHARRRDNTNSAAAEHSKFSLPGNRVRLKTTGLRSWFGIGRSMPRDNDAARDPAPIPESNFAFVN